MTNRSGKREREARRRHKRPWVVARLRTGTVLPALKLGRKKVRSFIRSSRFDCWMTCHDYLYVGAGPPEYMVGMVSEAESQERNGRRAGDVSEPESSPASGQDQS